MGFHSPPASQVAAKLLPKSVILSKQKACPELVEGDLQSARIPIET
jgi:hypothetical protein